MGRSLKKALPIIYLNRKPMADKEINFKPKMRITLLDHNGAILNDRLVDAYSEMNIGPKSTHDGPIRVELTLTSQNDIEGFKKYIDQLSGQLPLRETAGRGRPNSAPKEIDSPRENILQDVEKLVSEGKNQDDVIKYLRKLGFVFLLTEDFLQYFPEFEFNKKDIGEPTDNGQYLNSLSWLVRCIKRAKTPQADKFDPMVIFGFSIQGGPSNKVVPYLYKERKKPLRIKPGKQLTFNKVEFSKMPKYMIEAERLKFSAELRALTLDENKNPSKFFLRWAPEVEIPKTTWEKLKNRNIKFKKDYSD